jgi:hypothetical protein
MMAALAEKIQEREIAPIRRFEMADLSKHGLWLMKRLLQAFPDMTEQSAGGYIRSILYSNDSYFLFQEHAVALAQFVSGYDMRAKPVVQERFVFVENKSDDSQIEAAADFYTEFYRWALLKGIEEIIVDENTDVPRALIEERTKARLFKRELMYLKVK